MLQPDLVALFFEKLRFDLKNPENPNNDRVIFSKGHASPLVYALYRVAGVLTDKDIDSYRMFGSELEGHPNPRFKYIDVATGSLGQGLAIGLGTALALRAQSQSSKVKVQSFPKVYVLMGDSGISEGSVWEAIELASYYKLDNLVGIIDVNRLGQSQETMLGWNIDTYRERIEAFGWEAIVCDGHNFEEILDALNKVGKTKGKPLAIIARTIKGKGVRSSKNDRLTIVACGVTLVEAIKAADELKGEGINVRVIDAYSVKPISEAGLKKAARETNNLIITVEDHYSEGGLGDAVLNVFADKDRGPTPLGVEPLSCVRVYKMAVYKMPRSGKPAELLDYEGISARAIVAKVKEIL